MIVKKGVAKQPYLPTFEKLKLREFGGSRIKGHARQQRPLSTRRPLHLVLRSSLARRERSFLHPKRSKQVKEILDRAAKKQGIKIYRYANSGNHLHLVILPSSRKGYSAFIRTISGRIARLVLGTERGRPSDSRFWDALPFTRLLDWGRDYRNACSYLLQNTLEALGFAPYRERRFRSTEHHTVLNCLVEIMKPKAK